LSFSLPKAGDSIALNSYQKMTTVLVDKHCDYLKKFNFEGSYPFCLVGNFKRNKVENLEAF